MDSEQFDPSVIIIFGITGDLSKRKLLPALYHLLRSGVMNQETKIIGISRRDLSVNELLNTVELCVLESDKVCDPDGLKKVRQSLSTLKLDPNNDQDFENLKQKLDELDTIKPHQRIFYMSIPASAYAPIVKNLSKHGLNGNQSRILLEKPFGYDYKSAETSISTTHDAFQENQIYRIDHYLAKETAQNILTFRLNNPIFLPIWNGQHISKVIVRQYETLTIEGRVNFYEQTGALRDVIQSHLMQLLALTLMDLHSDLNSDDIHAYKETFFKDLEPADPTQTVRAQYDGYRDEVNNPDSLTETYAKIVLKHNSKRWENTEIILEHGKAMNQTIMDITLEFKEPNDNQSNNLVLQIQPNEGISLDLIVKEPGFEDKMHHTALDFRYKNVFKKEQYVDAYERVMMDVIRGDMSLFASEQEVLKTWQVLQPILNYWAQSKDGADLLFYPIGSESSNLTN